MKPIKSRLCAAALVLGVLTSICFSPVFTRAVNPASDVTPAALITAVVTEEGLLRPDFGPALKAAIAAREARWNAEPADSVFDGQVG